MDLSGQGKLRANNGFSLTQLQPDGIDKHPSRNQKITPLRLVLVQNMLKYQSQTNLFFLGQFYVL